MCGCLMAEVNISRDAVQNIEHEKHLVVRCLFAVLCAYAFSACAALYQWRPLPHHTGCFPPPVRARLAPPLRNSTVLL